MKKGLVGMAKIEKVSVVKCNSYDRAKVKEALEKSLKNIGFEFKQGMKVLIKPNLLSPHVPEKAITTHPVIVEELCKILKKFGCEIFIGDSSAHDTEKALELSGMNKLKKYARVVNFEGVAKRFFDLGGGELNRVPLPKLVFDVDLVINFAKLKTHGLTQVTLCVKNLYGCVPGKLKENYHKVLPDAKRFSRLLVRIHDKIQPELNLIDGIVGLEGEGPGASGKPVKSGVVLASRSAYCADIVASEIMGFKPGRIYTNKFSGIKKKQIDVVGNGKNVKRSFKKPTSAAIGFFIWCARFFPRSKICFDKEKCVKCGICSKKCPVDAIVLKPYPDCSHKKCIRCLCCIEVCPHDAVFLKDAAVVRGMKAIVRKFRKV